MKKFRLFLIVCLMLALVNSSYAVLTKAVEAVDEWAEIAQNATREGATVDISGNYSTSLHIDMALTSAAVHVGTYIIVKVSSNTSGDEDWTTYKTRLGPGATAAPNGESLSGAEAAGQTVLEVASTTGYDADGARWIFIEDNTVADSEMCWLISHVGNTSVTVEDGTTNAHDASDTLWNVADSFTIEIPINYSRVKVSYDNTYDSDGATVHCRARISKTTGL
jgi:hypothetical protein